MNYKVIYTHDTQNNILYRHFSGTANIDNIIESWKECEENYFTKFQILGVITDLCDAKLEMSPDKMKQMEEYFILHDAIYKDLLLAVVIDNPQIAIPMLFANKIKATRINAFSSVEMAKEWILDNSILPNR